MFPIGPPSVWVTAKRHTEKNQRLSNSQREIDKQDSFRKYAPLLLPLTCHSIYE